MRTGAPGWNLATTGGRITAGPAAAMARGDPYVRTACFYLMLVSIVAPLLCPPPSALVSLSRATRGASEPSEEKKRLGGGRWPAKSRPPKSPIDSSGRKAPHPTP